VDTGSITIPKSFMGMSHEWNHIEEIYDMPEYKDVIQLLNSYGGGPHVMRVGGGSTDLQTTVPGSNVWNSLAALYRETGTRYILGLNFEKGDVELARRQMQAALNGLPADAIISFEIGNEVGQRSSSGRRLWSTIHARFACTVAGRDYLQEVGSSIDSPGCWANIACL
jgi:hypothetical protein